MAWAVVMSQAAWIERSLFPYAVVLQCIPILALVPLIGILFGYNFQARVIVTILIALFPMVSMTLFGLQSVAKQQRELFQLQGVSRATLLRKLQFPAALPSIFVGLRTSAGLAVVGAVVGDQFFQRGNPGLGVLIQVYASRAPGPPALRRDPRRLPARRGRVRHLRLARTARRRPLVRLHLIPGRGPTPPRCRRCTHRPSSP